MMEPQLLAAANLSLPLALVLPYAGPIGVADKARLASNGWYLCDGDEVSRGIPLFGVIGDIYGRGDGVATFNLPDYRGRFLRGVDDPTGNDAANRDPDAAERVESGVGGFTGNRIGSLQPDATALPSNPYVMGVAGAHHHRVMCETDASRDPKGGSLNTMARYKPKGANVFTNTQGHHTHELSGGDNETRPENLYINFIVFGGV